MDWYDLAPYWDRLTAVAKRRDRQKKAYQSSRYWNDNPHFIN